MGKIWDRIKLLSHRFRFSVFDSKNLTEVYRVTLSRFQGLGIVGSIWASGAVFALLLVFFTPLKQCVPGYPREKFQRSVIEAALKLDSLEYQITLRDSFLTLIQGVILGEINDTANSSIIPKRVDSIEFIDLKSQDVFSDLMGDPNYRTGPNNGTRGSEELAMLNFYPPLKGLVTSPFDANARHYAVDVVGPDRSAVCATMAGTVIFAEWSIQTGYVIVIQHDSNLLSVYKHNSEIRVRAGEKVRAGELIALMGNEGELSVGPHLHFELWQNGKPIDPEKYVLFNGF